MWLSASLCLLLAASPAVTFAPGSATAKLLAETRISSAQARSIALQRVVGAVLAEELEQAGTRWVYTFEIRPIRVEQGVQVVQVDAVDGSVVSQTRKGRGR